MIVGILVLGFAALIFSLYQLFVANDAVNTGAAIFRTMLSVLVLVAARFEEGTVLSMSVLMFALTAIMVMASIRKETQTDGDSELVPASVMLSNGANASTAHDDSLENEASND